MKDISQSRTNQLLKWPNMWTRIANLITVSLVAWVLIIGSPGGSAGVALAVSSAAADYTYSTDEDTVLTVPAKDGVLSSFDGVDKSTLTPEVIADPVNGAVSLRSDGSFTYTPNPDFYGTNSFTYKISDGATDYGTATVTLTINPVNDAPVAANDEYTLAEDTPLIIADMSQGLLANDADVEKDTLMALEITPPAHGKLDLKPDGTFTYTPNANYYGTDSFTYKASDGTADSGTATVTLTLTPVSDVPVALPDSFSTIEDTALNTPAPGILTNDYDADGDVVSIAGHTYPGPGKLQLNGNGSFTYAPAADFYGTDTFTYWITAGSATTEPVTVTINVQPANDAPVAGNDAYVASEDTPLNVATASNGVLQNDADIDSISITALVDTPLAHGKLDLKPDGTFTYTPNANYYGTDSFTYKASDGTIESSTATVTLTINPVNDVPVAAGDTYRVDRNGSLMATVGVLANDGDIDGDALTAAFVTKPVHGTLEFYSDGTFSYTPESGYLGTDSFTYIANDGTVDSVAATVVMTVNTAPVASDNSYSVNEDTTLTVSASGILGNDVDPDGSTLTAVRVAEPGHGTLTLNSDGSFVYMPWTNFHGSDWFTYRAYDGAEYSEIKTVTITVNSINDIPYAYDDVYVIDEDCTLHVDETSGVLINDADADGDSLKVYVQSGTGHGTLNMYSNGSFTYKPDSDYNGQDSFTYRAGDGNANSTTATVRIKVNSVNDMISLSEISHPDFPTEVGETVKISLTFKDKDQGGPRTAQIFWGDGEIDRAKVWEDSGSGTISGEYAYKKPGTYQITVMVIDGGEGPITRDTGRFEVVAEKAKPTNVNNSSIGPAMPTASVTATISPTTAATPTAMPTTENTAPSSGWQSWAIYAMLLGMAVAVVAGYLVLFRRKG